MMILPGACVITFGKMVRDRKKAQQAENGELAEATTLEPAEALLLGCTAVRAEAFFAAMGNYFPDWLRSLLLVGKPGNPALQEIGVSSPWGSMEGKEVRFGIAQSAMFTTTTTSFTTGTVNNMHDTLTPLGGMIPLLHMMLNVVFGGKGVGLMNMIMYAILAVFICG